jgi:hypothetical protein
LARNILNANVREVQRQQVDFSSVQLRRGQFYSSSHGQGSKLIKNYQFDLTDLFQGALKVEVTGGISDSFKITFYEYKHGDAPVLVKNYCPDLFLKIQQQDQSQVTLLSPYNSLSLHLDDPTKIRKLVWNVYNNKGSGFLTDIFKDAYGEEKFCFTASPPQLASQYRPAATTLTVPTVLNYDE